MTLAGAAAAACSTPPPFRFQPGIDQAFQHLYSSDYPAAQSALDQYLSQQPGDPVGYAVKASAYLFTELDRMGILESEFFESDKKIGDSHKRPGADPAARDAFYRNIEKAQLLSRSALAANPNDENALFAACLALGNQTDFMALIERRQLASLSLTRQSYRQAKHLLHLNPRFYDAYLSTGFTEYVFSSLPALVRLFVRFDDVRGDKQQALRHLQIVASQGHYLKPFAKILLATAALRDHRLRDAQGILLELTHSYPSNSLLQRELTKVNLRVGQGG